LLLLGELAAERGLLIEQRRCWYLRRPLPGYYRLLVLLLLRPGELIIACAVRLDVEVWQHYIDVLRGGAAKLRVRVALRHEAGMAHHAELRLRRHELLAVLLFGDECRRVGVRLSKRPFAVHDSLLDLVRRADR
jgi:hypothetical protein